MAEYAWFNIGGRQIYRPLPEPRPSRSSLPSPIIRKDAIAPVRSMADGRMYDSLSALRRTYRADGNPQGTEYTEIGDAPMHGPPPVKHASKAELSDLLDKVEAMHRRGEIPQAQSLD